MYGCESWTIKKAECQRIDVFELWCWRRLLRVPWTARRSNQSILKEISPEYSLEGLLLTLKLQYFGHLMWRTDSLKRPWSWEQLKARREGGNRGWDGWMASLTRWTWVWASSRSWWCYREAWRAAVHRVTTSLTRLCGSTGQVSQCSYLLRCPMTPLVGFLTESSVPTVPTPTLSWWSLEVPVLHTASSLDIPSGFRLLLHCPGHVTAGPTQEALPFLMVTSRNPSPPHFPPTSLCCSVPMAALKSIHCLPCTDSFL